MNKTKVYRAIFSDTSRIDAIAFVKYPAIIKTFDYKELSFTDRVFNMKLEGNLVVSPLLIPYQFIYRNDLEEYYIYYTEEDIIKVCNYILDNKSKIKFNYEHDNNRTIDGVNIIGVSTDIDGKEYSSYTLVIQLQINNNDLVNKIKQKDVRGLSIEGIVNVVEDGFVFGTIKDNKFKINK